MAHLVPPTHYEDVNRRLHLERLHPTTIGQEEVAGKMEGWQCRKILVRDYWQGRNLKPSRNISDGTSYKGRVYSAEVLTSQRYDKSDLITESNEFTPCIVHVSMNINNFSWCSHPFFPRALTRDMHDEYIQLMDQLASLLRSVNVTFAMGSGTLLGSYSTANKIFAFLGGNGWAGLSAESPLPARWGHLWYSHLLSRWRHL